MFQPHIRIVIQLDSYPSAADNVIYLPLCEYSIRKALECIDYPIFGTDAFTAAVFCTPKDCRDDIEINREALADAAGEHVKHKLLKLFNKNDTFNGNKQR